MNECPNGQAAISHARGAATETHRECTASCPSCTATATAIRSTVMKSVVDTGAHTACNCQDSEAA